MVGLELCCPFWKIWFGFTVVVFFFSLIQRCPYREFGAGFTVLVFLALSIIDNWDQNNVLNTKFVLIVFLLFLYALIVDYNV